jgi:hypothetical protein
VLLHPINVLSSVALKSAEILVRAVGVLPMENAIPLVQKPVRLVPLLLIVMIQVMVSLQLKAVAQLVFQINALVLPIKHHLRLQAVLLNIAQF